MVLLKTIIITLLYAGCASKLKRNTVARCDSPYLYNCHCTEVTHVTVDREVTHVHVEKIQRDS